MPLNLPQSRYDRKAIKDKLFALWELQPYGEQFPYPAISEVIGMDAQSSSGRKLVLAVGARLEREAQRSLYCMAGIGYRIAHPNEHQHISSRRQNAGRRKVNSAYRVLNATPLHLLTPDQRRKHDAYASIIRMQVDTLRNVVRVVEKEHATVSALLNTKLAEAVECLERLDGK